MTRLLVLFAIISLFFGLFVSADKFLPFFLFFSSSYFVFTTLSFVLYFLLIVISINLIKSSNLYPCFHDAPLFSKYSSFVKSFFIFPVVFFIASFDFFYFKVIVVLLFFLFLSKYYLLGLTLISFPFFGILASSIITLQQLLIYINGIDSLSVFPVFLTTDEAFRRDGCSLVFPYYLGFFEYCGVDRFEGLFSKFRSLFFTREPKFFASLLLLSLAALSLWRHGILRFFSIFIILFGLIFTSSFASFFVLSYALLSALYKSFARYFPIVLLSPFLLLSFFYFLIDYSDILSNMYDFRGLLSVTVYNFLDSVNWQTLLFSDALYQNDSQLSYPAYLSFLIRFGILPLLLFIFFLFRLNVVVLKNYSFYPFYDRFSIYISLLTIFFIGLFSLGNLFSLTTISFFLLINYIIQNRSNYHKGFTTCAG